MTPAQNEILGQVRKLIEEHFDGAMLVVETEDNYSVIFVGPLVNAIGLTVVGEKYLHARLGEIVSESTD